MDLKLLIKTISLLLFSASCSNLTAHPKPDLKKIYSKPAKYHGLDRNPVILIPGILGSKLKDSKTGRIAWGAFGGEYVNPSTAEGFRAISFPITDSIPDTTDSLVPDGALDRIKIDVFGIPLSLNAYFEVISSLGAGGYRDQTLSAMSSIDHGNDHISCFQFAYDWRKDISSTSKDLEKFIEEKRAFLLSEYKKRNIEIKEKIKFDIVAHSMGGLIARYYLRYGAADINDVSLSEPVKWKGSKDMARLVLIGTPNAGSIDAFDALTRGRKYSPIHPEYPAQLLSTMPALYGLLPRPRHKHIVWKDSGQAVEIYDPKVWRENGWGFFKADNKDYFETLLPDTAPEERKNKIFLHLSEILRRNKKIHKALDKKVSTKNLVPISLIAGDAARTSNTLRITRGKSLKMEISEVAPGDGIVLRTSALLDERVGTKWKPLLQTPINYRNILFLFDDHLGLLRDPTFTDNLLFYLLEQS